MHDLVLIPGLGSDAAVWSRTIAELDGDAQCVVGDTLQDASLAAMARRILDESPAKFTLAGVSMGGMVALEIMRRAPGRVTGLAIFDSNPFPDTPREAEQRRRTIAAMQAGVDLRSAGEESLAWLVHPDADAAIKREIVEMGVRVGAEAYARQVEAVLQRADQRPILATIGVPTLVAHGADDAMIPVGCAQAMHAAIPRSTLEIIPNCGHLPPIERPRVVAGLLRNLIE